MNLQGGSDLWSLWRPRHSKGLVAGSGCHSFCIFFIFITYIHSIHLSVVICRGISPLSLHSTPSSFISAEWFGTEFREFASILAPQNGIRVVFSCAERFGREFREFASFFVQRNGIPSSFLFRGRVRNGFRELSVPRNYHLFRLFRLPRNYFFCRKFPILVTGQCKASQKNCVHHLEDQGGDGVPRQGYHGKGLQEVQVRYWECRRCRRPFHWKSLFSICSFANLFLFW